MLNTNNKLPVLKFSLTIIILLLVLFAVNIHAQNLTENQIVAELNKRDIDPLELKNRLIEKGIDIDNLDNLDASEALKFQSIIEETIAEMQSENSRINNESATIKIDQKFDSAQVHNLAVNTASNNNKTRSKNEEKHMPIYGQELFINQHIDVYNTTSDTKVSTKYILGNGDEISVSIWGLSTLDNVYMINNKGYISPNRMPRIYLRGMSIEKAKIILKNRFSKYYRFNNNEFEVTLNTARTIQVNIFGEVANYGGFTLPATNTAFNAIVAAGGPTALGSVRNIKLIRGDKIKRLDVYKWMKDPSVANDFYLQHNDFIQIPKAERVVSIKGEIERAMYYELLPNENLNQLIEYAGGLKINAYLKHLKIRRYEEEKQILIDVPYSSLQANNGDFILIKGDEIIIDSINIFDENMVSVEGAVPYPGEFAWRENIKLSDLLNLVTFNPSVNKNIAFIQRLNPDSTFRFIKVSLEKAIQSIDSKENILLHKGDKLIVLGLQNNDKKAIVEIRGDIVTPSIFPYDYNESIRVSDLILLSGGLLNSAMAYGYIERLDPIDFGSKIYLRVNINQVVNNPNSKDNILLSPYDVLIVDSQTRFLEKAHFEILGASKNPGQYNYIKNLSLKDALIMSGGLTQSAANNRIDIFRINLQNDKPIKTIVASVSVDEDLNGLTGDKNIIQPFDQIVIRNKPEFEFQKLVFVKGEVKYPGPYALIIPNEPLSSIISRAGGLTREAFPQGSTLYREMDSLGYIVINLNKALRYNKSRDNIILKKGDQLFIPKQKDLVSIEGATNASDLYYDEMLNTKQHINVPFHKGKNALYYVKEYAAGVSKTGDKNYITVQHPNGHIEYTRNYILFKRYPKVQKGSIVKVGYKKVKKPKKEKKKREVDWSRVSQNMLTQATLMLTILSIIKSL